MCGIVGYHSSNDHNLVDRAWAVQALAQLRHRGPDGEGKWISPDGKVFLGHTLLSLVDEPCNSLQPIQDERGQFTLSFNGEIYNHKEIKHFLNKNYTIRWKSSTDTEVLLQALHLLGIDKTLLLLRGMFSFALHDSHNNKMYLARDHSGEKPLYFYLSTNELFFASELKALMCNRKLPRRISSEALNYILATGYSPTELCILQGYKKVEPGSYIIYDGDSSQIHHIKYWDVSNLQPARPPYVSLRQSSLCLERLLRNAVEEQLSSAHPAAILLSGGLDSSILTALSVQAREEIQTFSVAFESTGYDESSFSKSISDYFSTKHITVICEPPSIDDLSMLAKQFDEPIIDSSVLACYQCFKAVSSHTKLALGGDGADELFGGYKSYQRALIYNEIRKLVHPVLRDLMSSLSTRLPRGTIGKKALRDLSSEYDRVFDSSQDIFDIPSRYLLSTPLNRLRSASNAKLMHPISAINPIDQRLIVDYKNYLREDLIVKNERASMLNSVEYRMPYLDKRVVELAFTGISPEHKVSRARRKAVLQDVGHRLLPSNFNYNRKKGFSVPVKDWIFEGGLHSILLESERGETLFAHSGVKILDQQARTTTYGAEGIFGLIMLELWRKEFDCTF